MIEEKLFVRQLFVWLFLLLVLFGYLDEGFEFEEKFNTESDQETNYQTVCYDKRQKMVYQGTYG